MARTSIITPEKFATFGELLRFLRRKANLTQRELSIAVGYSESQISRLEQNERAPEEATLAARFVPALYIEDEPQWIARLLELGAVTHINRSEVNALQPIAEAKPIPHNLPIQLTSFIGREKEMVEIKRFLSVSEKNIRLLTITGAGGSGKTRLALQVAHHLLEFFPDGVWFIELAPLTEPALVPQTVAIVLGLKQEMARHLVSTLTDHLRAKKTLLILDNCEHLVQSCAQFVEGLLHACSELHILITSREALGVAGEKTILMPPLSSPDPLQSVPVDMLTQYEAVQLFLERAAMTMPGFALTQKNACAITQVCHRLDGIPLAIEMAAARVNVLQVEQIAERLDDRFHLLVNTNRATLPRHQTLQRVIDWSHELLTERERILLRRVSVFAGGWTLPAAEAVCAGEGIESNEILVLLAQLVNKSLIVVDREQGKEARYQILETIRQYASEKLTQSGEMETIQRQHGKYYLKMAVATSESESEPRFIKLEHMVSEYDNLRTALTRRKSVTDETELGLHLASWLIWFWQGEGHWNEGREWLESALAHAEARGINDPLAQARTLSGLGNIFAFQGDYAAAQERFAQSLQLFEELGERRAVVDIHERLGWLAREQGDLNTAFAWLQQALALAKDLDDACLIGGVTNTLSEAMIMRGDVVMAKALLEENLSLGRKIDNLEVTLWALNHLGHVAQIQNEYERARQYHAEALTLARIVGPKWMGVLESLHCLGETALAQGNIAAAESYLSESLILSQDTGERACMAWCLAGLAAIAAIDEEPKRAAWLWGAAEALRQSIGVREGPASHATHERLKNEVRNQLGEAVFNAKWAEGQAASVEQAIDEATR